MKSVQIRSYFWYLFSCIRTLFTQCNAQKMNFFVKNLFSKCEHIRIKLLIYSINKFLMENFVFCVVNFFGFTTQSCKFFFEPNCQSLVYFIFNQHSTQISIQSPLQKSIFGTSCQWFHLDHCRILYFNKIACLYLFPQRYLPYSYPWQFF